MKLLRQYWLSILFFLLSLFFATSLTLMRFDIEIKGSLIGFEVLILLFWLCLFLSQVFLLFAFFKARNKAQ